MAFAEQCVGLCFTFRRIEKGGHSGPVLTRTGRLQQNVLTLKLQDAIADRVVAVAILVWLNWLHTWHTVGHHQMRFFGISIPIQGGLILDIAVKHLRVAIAVLPQIEVITAQGDFFLDNSLSRPVNIKYGLAGICILYIGKVLAVNGLQQVFFRTLVRHDSMAFRISRQLPFTVIVIFLKQIAADEYVMVGVCRAIRICHQIIITERDLADSIIHRKESGKNILILAGFIFIGQVFTIDRRIVVQIEVAVRIPLRQIWIDHIVPDQQPLDFRQVGNIIITAHRQGRCQSSFTGKRSTVNDDLVVRRSRTFYCSQRKIDIRKDVHHLSNQIIIARNIGVDRVDMG